MLEDEQEQELEQQSQEEQEQELEQQSQDESELEGLELEALANKFESPITQKDINSLANTLNLKREDTRSILAKVLITILGGTYFLVFVTMLLIMLSPNIAENYRKERYSYSKDNTPE